jgi:hypothetical protein
VSVHRNEEASGTIRTSLLDDVEDVVVHGTDSALNGFQHFISGFLVLDYLAQVARGDRLPRAVRCHDEKGASASFCHERRQEADRLRRRPEVFETFRVPYVELDVD